SEEEQSPAHYSLLLLNTRLISRLASSQDSSLLLLQLHFAKMSKLVARIPVLAKSAVDAATPKLNTFIRYAKVELVPPTPAEFGSVAQGFGNIVKSAQTGAWKQLTVKDASRNTLVAIEVLCWFFIGECIGKGTIVGYQV
ncbi:hypothetical protein OTU49_004876, partial [Cherax quadricarinatus]